MILIPIGTKAQLIKMAPVIKSLEQQCVPFHFVLTGQHRETMDDLITSFELPEPDYFLVKPVEANTSMKLLKWLLKCLREHLFYSSLFQGNNYKICLVHGDTLSTLVCAMLARRYKVKVAHVEAGLRSFNYFHPFPEEIVRIIVSRLSQIYFYAGLWAGDNLSKYRCESSVNIFNNTLLDSVKYAIERKGKKLPFDVPERFIIVSIHRFENLSNSKRLNFILDQVVSFQKKIQVLFVLHPATREKLQERNMIETLAEKGIIFIPRLDYVDFLALLNLSSLVVTDGGSNQEECSYLKKPCLLMRGFTERQEGLNDNVVLSQYDERVISTFIERHISNQSSISPINENNASSPSNIIVSFLKDVLANEK